MDILYVTYSLFGDSRVVPFDRSVCCVGSFIIMPRVPPTDNAIAIVANTCGRNQISIIIFRWSIWICEHRLLQYLAVLFTNRLGEYSVSTESRSNWVSDPFSLFWFSTLKTSDRRLHVFNPEHSWFSQVELRRSSSLWKLQNFCKNIFNVPFNPISQSVFRNRTLVTSNLKSFNPWY